MSKLHGTSRYDFPARARANDFIENLLVVCYLLRSMNKTPPHPSLSKRLSTHILFAYALVLTCTLLQAATVNVTVKIESLAPENGTYLTPVWVGFHDGNFDLFEVGIGASDGLQRLAEDGNTLPIGDEFLAPDDLDDLGGAVGAGVVNGTISSGGDIPPIPPGATTELTFSLDSDAFRSRYFTFASMVIPSNDAFIGNADPTAHPVFNDAGEFIGGSFVVTGAEVYDAGTEVNDELPANTAFFGQAAADTGTDENGTVQLHSGFKPAGSGGILADSGFANADFKAGGYQVVRITLTASEPEPQIPPTFELGEPIVLQNAFGDLATDGANLAVNTDTPEVLFTTIDSNNFDGLVDPITGEIAFSAVLGFFYDPMTLEPISTDPFIIVGNPESAGFDTLDVKYNPVSQQYVVAASANGYPPNGHQMTLMAIVNPSAAAGDRIAKAFVYEPDTDQNFDDVALAVSSKNGNILLAGERNFAGEGEGAIGALFDSEGNLLTPQFGRLDQIQPTGDEDDPDVVYLENNDVFLYVTNTDGDILANRITGSIIQTVPAADGSLQVGEEQILGASRKAIRQGHPAAFENPFNSELIGAFDYGNGSDGGDIFYFNIGQPPSYILSQARGQVPYFEATGSDPFNHRHPQFAADPSNGVIVIGNNPHNNPNGLPSGYSFTLLGPDGRVLPGESEEHNGFHAFVENVSSIDNGANNHNLKYDPFSDSFIAVYADGNETFTVRLKVTSNHLPEPSRGGTLVASSSGSLSTPTVVNFGDLSGSVSYEFVFDAVKAGASTAIAGDNAFAIKLDQWNEQGVFGTTEFGVVDSLFTAVNGQSVATVFGRRVHVVVVSDTGGSESRLYVDGVHSGTWAGNFVLAGEVKVMGARITQETDHMGDGSVMDHWATYQGALTDAEIADLAAVWTVPSGLAAYWGFDGDLSDSVGSFDGEARGTVGFADGQAGFGQAISLDGTSFVEITDSSGLEFPGGSMSISGWFTVGSFDKSWQALIAKGEGTNYRVARRSSENSIAYAGGVGEGPNDAPDVNDGGWHHFVAVSDATAAEFGTALYVDGVMYEVNATAPVLDSDTTNLYIGENPEALNRQWIGLIDDIGIWNRVLTAGEVSALYNGGTGTALSTLGVEDGGGGAIGIARSAGGVTITFEGTLQSSDSVTGPYTDIAGATSPTEIPLSGAAQFFRARQ